MSEAHCYDCKHYHIEYFPDGFNDEWCKVNNIYLHDENCPNYEKD